MKVAVTADVHLRTRLDHPERYNALENIFEQIEAEGIHTLIIAGDLFDKDFCTYVQFERLCRAHPSVHVHIIPGNHDSGIGEALLRAHRPVEIDHHAAANRGENRFLWKDRDLRPTVLFAAYFLLRVCLELEQT